MVGAGAAIDVRTRRIPNRLTVAAAALGVLLAATGLTRVTVVQSLLGITVAMLLMLPGHLLGGTGAGDVKLLGAAGAILGVGRVPAAFLFSAIAGGLLALAVAIARGRLGRSLGGAARVAVVPSTRLSIASHADNSFPYGPAIAVGSLVAALGIGI